MACVLLEEFLELDDHDNEEAAQEIAHAVDDDNKDALDLGRIILDKGGSWNDIMNIYRDIVDLPVESVRLTIAGLTRNRLIKTKKEDEIHLYGKILEFFNSGIFENKPENKLVSSIFKAYTIRRNWEKATN